MLNGLPNNSSALFNNLCNHFFLIFLLVLAVTSGVFAEPQQDLPSDVSAFVEKRDLCDHFRGEEPYDEERREFLIKNIIKLCTGTDKELANLKEKYKDNNTITEKMSTYEEDIEPNN